MIQPPSFPFSFEKKFSGIHDVDRVSTTLHRLATLEQSLKKKRLKELSELEFIWTEAQKQLAVSFENAVGFLQSKLSPYHKSIRELFLPSIESAQTVEELQKCLIRFFKDTQSYSVAGIIKKSNQGLNGPTLIIDYSRLDKTLTTIQWKNFVVKWANTDEIRALRIYGAFQQILLQGGAKDLFCVPKALLLDFKRQQAEKTNGELIKLESVMNKQLYEKFLAITRLSHPEEVPEDESLIIMEKISGENLFDFICSKYNKLSTKQKHDLMFNLGRLSLLDMVLGNFDRLVYITLDKEENRYKISDSEVNLGNIMLDWKDTEQNAPVLYVIDNSIHSEVLENPDACLALIEQFVAQPPAYHYIAEMMVISIQKALNSLSRDNKTMDPKKLQKMMKFFSKDLKKFGKDEINGGLNEMSKVLKSTLSTVWNKQEELRDYLEKTEPVKEKTESNEEKTRCSLYSLVSMNIEKFLSF